MCTNVLSQVKKSSQSFTGSEAAVKSADKKLIFVPLIFVILRIWNIISDPMLFYFRIRHSYASLIAVMLKVICTQSNLFCKPCSLLTHQWA